MPTLTLTPVSPGARTLVPASPATSVASFYGVAVYGVAVYGGSGVPLFAKTPGTLTLVPA